MCGIYGYLGHRNGVRISIDGLKKIEYRGYDSAGLACINGNKIEFAKEVGRISQLESMVQGFASGTVIAHTRWATHGKITKENAHPHLDENETIAVVHNGIIENHEILRRKLQEEGVRFKSETDAEIIPHLISRFYEGDFLKAVQQALVLLSGSYAIAVLHKKHPDQIVVAAHGCPLVIGIGTNEMFFASDPNALIHHTREVVYLANGEVSLLEHKGIEIFDSSFVKISKKTEQLLHSVEEATKGEFEHYTLKEIFEQPQTIRNAMQARFFEDYGNIALDSLNFSTNDLLAIKHILIIACGTSWHAGCVASYMIEDLAGIPCQVEVSSEFAMAPLLK